MGKTWKRRHAKTPPKTAGRKAAWNHVPTKKFPTRRSVEEAIEDDLHGTEAVNQDAGRAKR